MLEFVGEDWCEPLNCRFGYQTRIPSMLRGLELIVWANAFVRLAHCPGLGVRQSDTVVAPLTGLRDAILVDSLCHLWIPTVSESCGHREAFIPPHNIILSWSLMSSYTMISRNGMVSSHRRTMVNGFRLQACVC